MIFKQIYSSVDKTRKTLALFNKDWNTYKSNWQNENGIKGKIGSIFTSPNANTSIISNEQIQILRNWNNAVAHGCTSQETFNRIIANADDNTKMYFAGLNKGKGSIEGLKKAQNVATQSTVGLTIAQTALNMAISLGLTALISLIVKGYDELANSVENCKERVDDLISSHKSALETANNNANRVEELADKYEKLSKGVNSLGENVSLTNEEYEEYNSLVNEIAEMFPALVQGWTDEGTAVLNLKGNIEQLRDAYKEAQQEAYNLLIVSGKDSDGNDIIKQWEDTHDTGFWASLLDLGAEDIGGRISVSDALKQLKVIQNMTAEEYREIERITGSGSRKEIAGLSDIEKDIGYGSYLYKALGLNSTVTDEDFSKAQTQARALIQTYNAEIESALSDVETLANAYLMTNEDYDKLDAQAKTAASLLVNSLNADIANNFSSKEDVGTYVDGIVHEILSNTDARKAIVDLFTLDTSDMSMSDIESQVDSYIGVIATAIDEDSDSVKVRLGFDDSDTKPLINNVKEKLQDDFDNKVGELTLEELHIVAEQIEVPDGALLSWDELITKIREVQNSTSNIENPILSLPDAQKLVNGLKDGETETLGLIDELSLLQEILSDTGNIQQETYAKLLSCSSKYSTAIRTENGRITLNTTKLKQVAKSRQLDTEEVIRQTLALRKQEWIQWANNIENYNGTLLESIISKYTDIDALQNEITQYELLTNSVNEASNAFENFKTAQSSNDQDMYDTAQEAFNILKEYTSDTESKNYGKYNTDEFQEAVMLLMDTDTYRKAVNAKDLEEYQKVISSFVKTLNPLFDEKNYNSAASLFDRIQEIMDSGDIPKADKDWAKRLGISEETFHALSQLGNLYDFNNKEIFEGYQLNTLDNYYEKLQAVKSAKDALNAIEDKDSKEYIRQDAELKRLTESYDTFVNDTAQKVSKAFADFQQNPNGKSFVDYLKESFDFDDNDITGSLMAIIDKSGDLQKTLDSISLNEVVQSQQEEYQELQNLNQIISTLNENGYSSVDVEVKNKSNFNEVYDEYEKLRQKVLEYQKAISNSDNPHEINELNDYLSECVSNMDKLREPLRIEIEANIERVNSQLESVKSKINELNSKTSLSPYQQERLGVLKGEQAALENQQATLEAQLKVIVDDSEVKDWKAPDDKKMTVTTQIDDSAVTSWTAPEKTMKVRAVVDTSGLTGSLGGLQGGSGTPGTSNTGGASQGGSHAKGTVGNAFANGYNGLHTDEKNALRSEYGQKEMTVYPDGRYEITETPTLSDLPKGTVIFNEKQTNRILKGISHFKGTVGKAFKIGTGTKINLPNLADVISNNNAISGAKNNSSKPSTTSDSPSRAVQEAKEATEEFFDWIERRIKKFQAAFDKWIKQAETAVTSGFINKYYKKATSAIKNELSTYGKAYKRYMKQADSIGLSKKYRDKVKNGTIDIETIKDEKLVEQIKKYQEWCVNTPLYLVTGGGILFNC